MKNYYKTLGISQNCSKNEIKKAFRELALKYHPDKHQDEAFAEKFKEINEAKQVLLDDLKKFKYDASLAHFLSESSPGARLKQRKRKNYRHNYALAIIKESISNKYFIGILLSVTVLLTIAFLTIPSEEPEFYSPVSKKEQNKIESDPEAPQPILATTYVAETATKELTELSNVEKLPLKVKTAGALVVNNNHKVKKHFHKWKSITSKTLVRLKHYSVSKKPLRNHPSASKSSSRKKLLTQLQMVAILNRIKAEKARLVSNSNCVQIVKTKTSNIANAFMLAHFLKGYGYVISGREKITENIDGISIDAKDCVVVTIGIL